MTAPVKANAIPATSRPLTVLSQDLAFGGGGRAQVQAFTDGARQLGYAPRLIEVVHPALHGRRWTPDRIEFLRQARSARRLAPLLGGGPLWVAATIATHGAAAARSGRPYSCWLGTSLEDEWSALRRGGGLRAPLRDLSIPPLRRLERRTISRAERVYATSPASRAAVAAAGGIDEATVGILPIPVDVDAFSPEPDEVWAARLAAPVVAFVGRGDDPRKNVELLLEAWPAIRSRLPRARLRLIGRPPACVPAGAEALGEVQTIVAALREAALLVVPSWQEGFGIVAAEALAAGVPVLSTPCGGPEHLLATSGGGRLLQDFSAGELAAAAVELLEDTGTLTAMRGRGREYVLREHSPARFRQLLAAALG